MCVWPCGSSVFSKTSTCFWRDQQHALVPRVACGSVHTRNMKGNATSSVARPRPLTGGRARPTFTRKSDAMCRLVVVLNHLCPLSSLGTARKKRAPLYAHLTGVSRLWPPFPPPPPPLAHIRPTLSLRAGGGHSGRRRRGLQHVQRGGEVGAHLERGAGGSERSSDGARHRPGGDGAAGRRDHSGCRGGLRLRFNCHSSAPPRPAYPRRIRSVRNMWAFFATIFTN